jgi:hypothetical protein
MRMLAMKPRACVKGGWGVSVDVWGKDGNMHATDGDGGGGGGGRAWCTTCLCVALTLPGSAAMTASDGLMNFPTGLKSTLHPSNPAIASSILGGVATVVVPS